MAVLKMTRGAPITYGGIKMRFVAAKDFEVITLRAPDGQLFNASIKELEEELMNGKRLDVHIDMKRQAKVPAYVQAFGPLLGLQRRTKAQVKAAASSLGISVSTGYACLARYDAEGTTDVLPAPTRSGGPGARIKPEAEAIIQQTLEDVILSRRNHSPAEFFKQARRRLAAKEMKVSQSTLEKRLANLPHDKVSRARLGHAESRRLIEPIKGSQPETTRPFEEIQIDHWKADIEILSDDRLTVIGRVWLTLAIDIYTRMILGVHVGIDEPSTTTLGMMMINALTTKHRKIASLGLNFEMPMAGPPERITADNAGEFTRESFRLSCLRYNIQLRWRPVDSPQYGGHIERLNGTLASKFKALPGATGSTTSERKLFNPNDTAAFTLQDLEKHIYMILDEYHNEIHMGIRTTPLEKYKSYYYSPSGQKHKLPDVIADTPDFRRNWYPLVYRTVQRYGFRIDHLEYYDTNIRNIVKNRKTHGKIAIRRDPFNVKIIHIRHPIDNEWIAVSTRHFHFPDASLFELRAAIKEALRLKRSPTTLVLRGIIEKQQAHIEEVIKRKRGAERDAARRSHHTRIRNESPKPRAPLLEEGGPKYVVKMDKTAGFERTHDQPILAPAQKSIAGKDPSRVMPTLSAADIDACFND